MGAGQDFEAIFRVFDQDGSGCVDRSELEAMLRALGGSGEGDVERVLAEMDLDRNGTLTFSEFAKVCEQLLS
ncbi:EF-hand domain-containing protein [Nocardia sp. CDC159]|uniref:EF-hand domain-containing protein n=1 Tax=Nocardia pulmonis TaxID=2951408 RepID=A0A9X2J3F7_9NOCA|nr:MULTISPECIES: EF-hand domain-containing protein [Nocardia]MCM6779051.1 EF-hand domain-containing protein [Nocardia pulmonis]MCM6791941.1 EF-hand domain-containing protein [Nocardia sp. CDC159]